MAPPNDQGLILRFWVKVQEDFLNHASNLTVRLLITAGIVLIGALWVWSKFIWIWLYEAHLVSGWTLAVLSLAAVLVLAETARKSWLLLQRWWNPPALHSKMHPESPSSTTKDFHWQETGSTPKWVGTVDLVFGKVTKIRPCCPGIHNGALVDVHPKATGSDGSVWKTWYECYACGGRWDGAFLRPEAHREAVRKTLLAKWQAGELTLIESIEVGS